MLPVSEEAGGEDDSDPRPEDDEEDDGDGDGSGDLATLALDVPEPEQAMAANEALAKGGKNQPKGKGKGKKGVKGGKAGIDVVLDEAMIGLEEEGGDDPDAETESAEISAYDSDEITDPDQEDIDPLMVLVGAREKPWENEKLSLVERMMLNPGYERDLEATRRGENGPDQDKAKDKDKDKAAKIGKMAATAAGAAALGMAAAKGAQAARNDIHTRAQPSTPQGRSGQGMAGIARGPQRAADQDQGAPQKAEQRKADNTTQFNNTQPITYQARQNAQEVTMRRMENGLAASLDNKSVTALSATRNPSSPRAQNGDEIDDNLMQMIESHLRSEYSGVNWTPQAAAGDGFRQAMDMIYAALGAQNLLEVSPYRQAGWDEKRQEHKENSQDVTIAAPAPEPKAPVPEPSLEREPQINFGPGGM